MGKQDFNTTRSSIASKATGVVLEIGFGSGYNLPFYKNIEKLYALEPSLELYNLATDRIKKVSFPITFLQNSAEKIPLADDSVDSVISTWTLCSIANVDRALSEVCRVLKPNGKFIFAEHGKSDRKFSFKIQKLITPITKRFAGNCHLDREIDASIMKAGFRLTSLEKYPESGRPLMFSYIGAAIKR